MGPEELPSAAPSFATPRHQRGRYAAFSRRLALMLATADFAFGLAPKRARPITPGGPWRVLFCNGAHLGDMVVHLPLIARLAAAPQISALTVLTAPAGQAVLKTFLPHLPTLGFEHWSLDRGGRGRMAAMLRDAEARPALVKRLKAESFDVAIDSYAWFGNASTVLWSAGIPVRLGFESGGGGPLYTHAMPFAFPGPDKAVAARTEVVLTPLIQAGLALPQSAPLAFSPDPEASQVADQAGRYAVLHLGRGDHSQAWDLAGWRAVAAGLKSNGYRIVFTGAAAEAEYGRSLRQEIADFDLVGRGGLAYFATILQRAGVLVSVDTVAPHLAALFETPTVIVPPQKQALHLWRPPGRRVQQVTTPVACSPCFRKNGCAEMACVRHTPPAAVLAAVQQVTA